MPKGVIDIVLDPIFAFALGMGVAGAGAANCLSNGVVSGYYLILTPLAYDAEHLYPREYLLGRDALDILEQYTGVRLPESEAISVTPHILNAEIDKNDMHDTLMQIEILQAVDGIIRDEMGIRLETSGFAYPLTCDPADVLECRQFMNKMNWYCSDVQVRGAYPYYARRFWQDNGITPSMSRRGDPYDNAMVENFFSILKTECICRHKPATFSEANEMIDRYIHFYNHARIQTKTGMTPLTLRHSC